MKTNSLVKRIVLFLARALGCVLLLIVLVLGWLWIQNNKRVILPRPTGPYAVGRAEFDWVDESRLETLMDRTDKKRELEVWLWYPAETVRPSDHPAEYLPSNWRKARESGQGFAARFLMQNLGSVQCHAVEDAPLAHKQASYPVLIFEPGLGPIVPDYTTLAEEMASQGYIVAACTPTCSASVVVFQDGRAEYATTGGSIPDAASVEESNKILNRLIKTWADDDVFVLNQLEKLNRSHPGTFAGKLDLQSVGVFGHSFGGCAAAEVCHLDSRFKAAVNIDGYPRGDVIESGMTQPLMFIWSVHNDAANAPDAELEQANRNIQAIYNRLTNGGCQITLKGARHFNFTDNGLFCSSFFRMQHAMGTIDGRRALLITTDYLRAFFDHYLKGSDEPLLRSASPKYPEVIFESR
jgi:hypothetical protein